MFQPISFTTMCPGLAYFLIRCFDRQATKRFAKDVFTPVLEARLREDDDSLEDGKEAGL
ncbi:MAG: hypothetical protein P1V97_05670 [Planctomycetota bacterium]|nr:hypothetical protein [Planctomycetota bacterium]